MNIAIIGAGISGLTAAYYLQHQHQLTVYESAPEIGGHTATIDVDSVGKHYAIDTGFIVYNDWTYPNFIALLDELGIASQPTRMSFSVCCDDTGLEYAGSDLNTLFAQRKNLISPYFWAMLKDILRFNREAVMDLDNSAISPSMTLGEYLKNRKYSNAFCRHYLVPMGSAIWSAPNTSVLDFPLLFFVRFFKNHGLLSIKNRPQWRIIKGGSRSYLGPLTQGFKDRIITGAQLVSVQRDAAGAWVTLRNGERRRYDQVVMACHSDQALTLLADADRSEQQILGSIPYRENDVVLHTDARLLPDSRRAWSSWNYRLATTTQDSPVLTYNMNILQGINTGQTFCVTLNNTDAIDPAKIIRRFCYSHPVFSLASVTAADRWQEINGVRRTWFCGAYWGNGFHEDGVVSGRKVAEQLNRQERKYA